MKAVFICVALSAVALAESPSAPQWPTEWTADFIETISDKHTTVGTYYYDASDAENVKNVVYRSNGRNDAVCHSKIDEPCVQYIVEGKRYVHYPLDDECCFCCDSAHGCGAMKPSWLSTAEYQGEDHICTRDVYGWFIQGNEPNYYKETEAEDSLERIPVQYVSGSVKQDYLPETFVKSVNKDVFELPSKCSGSTKRCSLLSLCHIFQPTGQEEFLQ